MTLDNLLVKDYETEYPILGHLYNEWMNKTMFKSNLTFDELEYVSLLDYCKEHKEETANFYIDLVDAYQSAYMFGYVGSPVVGHFLAVVGNTFTDILPKHNTYIPMPDLQNEITEILKNNKSEDK